MRQKDTTFKTNTRNVPPEQPGRLSPPWKALFLGTFLCSEEQPEQRNTNVPVVPIPVPRCSTVP